MKEILRKFFLMTCPKDLKRFCKDNDQILHDERENYIN